MIVEEPIQEEEEEKSVAKRSSGRASSAPYDLNQLEKDIEQGGEPVNVDSRRASAFVPEPTKTIDHDNDGKNHLDIEKPPAKSGTSYA